MVTVIIYKGDYNDNGIIDNCNNNDTVIIKNDDNNKNDNGQSNSYLMFVKLLEKLLYAVTSKRLFIVTLKVMIDRLVYTRLNK